VVDHEAGVEAATREFLLAFADDEHLMGQRHTEWLGVAPFLEEDLAFASIGQDELGHAADLYTLAVALDRSDNAGVNATDAGSDGDAPVDVDVEAAIDRLAFNREPSQYRSCWLVEYETTDWAETAVRHWYYDSAERFRWESLADSTLPGAADLVGRALREESYHRRHIDGLLDVLLEVDESRRRIEFAAIELFPLAVGLFDPVVGEEALVAAGVIDSPWSDVAQRWEAEVAERFPTIDFSTIDRGSVIADQANRTRRHEHFAIVHSRIREVFEFDPEAAW
jgi:ring-1,2-phenylacetyl-CoA epoxidase subunit PaaC